ncbi:MAG: allantoinase AllB [Phycisphaerae bacterium]|nr:allantoinase AllB [Phycisphaerae bacterium]
MADELILRGTRILTPNGISPGDIIIREGRIDQLLPFNSATNITRLIDAADHLVMPGVIDTHVHINDPGREDWEGFETGTRAAAAGGITTIVDMPLNSIPATTTVAALETKRRAAQGRLAADVGFWAGLVPANARDLEPLAREGVLGFKCFMVPSGVAEFDHVTERDLREAAPILARLGLPLLVHAEHPAALAEAPTIIPGRERRYASHLASRPRAAEQRAIEQIIRLVDEFRVHAHIVHLSSADAIPALRAARRRGLPITVETCPHYLTFAAEDIPDGATQFKCAPPIRERENRERLWTALREGDIDLVASDHSPSPPSGKCLDTGDFARAWGGIASIQVSLAATWTAAASRGCTQNDLARWMCEAPARLAGLTTRKGRIAEGYDADLVIWNPDEEFVVRAKDLRHKHPLTAYEGISLRGTVERTILRGQTVFERGKQSTPGGAHSPAPGRCLQRGTS